MNKYFKIGVLVIIAAALFMLGWCAKPCAKVVSVKYKTDTVMKFVPIDRVQFVHTKPVSKLIVDTQYVAKEILVRDTGATFVAVDTLRHDSLYVAVQDYGNCYGIVKRRAVFGGAINERTITNTVTEVVAKPQPLFRLDAGAGALFNSKAFVDAGPAVALQLKNKHALIYSYMVFSNTHSLTLTTKIK